MVEFKLAGKYVAVLFPYRSDLVELARTMPNRRYDKNGVLSGHPKAWIVPATPHDIEKAAGTFREEGIGVTMNPEVLKIIERGKSSLEESRATEAEISVPTKIEPYPFQKAGIKFVSDHGGRALIADEMGCVDGEAEVLVQRTKITKRLKLKDLCRRWKSWDRRRITKIRALVDGEFHQHPISDVVDKGVKEVVEIFLKSGKRIKVTPDHEICTAIDKFVAAGNLKKGNSILTNGIPKCGLCSSTKNIVTYKHAKFRGFCRTCVYRKKRAKPTWIGGKSIDRDGYVRVSGMHGHPRAVKGNVLEHLLVMEKSIGRSVKRSEVVHHKNRIRHDNRIENLELTTVVEHMRKHGREGGYLNLNGGRAGTGGKIQFIPVSDKIVKIKKAGKSHVFDVVCADPHRNFVANGIVVHNCGKTPQALGWTLVSQELPALVLCPANLRINWLREAKKFTNLRCLIISSMSSLSAFRRQGLDVSVQPENGYDLVIANYDLLSFSKDNVGYLNEQSVADLMKLGFKTLICDEAHYLKEKTTQRSKAVLDLSSRMKNVLCLTGTPILNRPKELWHLARVVDPSIFPKFHDFGIRYCGAFKNRFGWVYDGASHLDELDKKLRSTIMIRRTKDQVLKELPPKTRVLMPFALESAQDRLYKKETSEAIQKLRTLKAERDQWRLDTQTLTKEELDQMLSKNAEKKARSSKLTGFMMEEIEKIRQACVRAKYDQCLSFIENLHGQEKKILIFAVHHETIDRLMADLSQKGVKVDRIDGRVDGAYRDAIKQRFQEGDLEVLVCGIRAAGEGLTLTASKSVVFMELDYTPGRMVQAEDRTHRVGQSQAVTIYYLLLMGSIEEKIAALVDSKREVANAALGEGARTLSETGILDSILDEAIGNED